MWHSYLKHALGALANFLSTWYYFHFPPLYFQIEAFFREKEDIFNKLFDLQVEFEERDDEVSELQREEVDRLRDLFRNRTKLVWNHVMAQEITLVSQTEKVIIDV